MKHIALCLAALLLSLSITGCGGLRDPYAANEDGTSSVTEAASAAEDDTAENTAGDETEAVTEEENIPFAGLVVGFSNVDLPVPPYQAEDGTVYADLAGFSNYFGCSISYDDEGNIAMVFLNSSIYTFDVSVQSMVYADVETQAYEEIPLSAPCIKTDAGMDVPVLDFASLLGFTSKWVNGYLVIYED